jgi:hypothetical protein
VAEHENCCLEKLGHRQEDTTKEFKGSLVGSYPSPGLINTGHVNLYDILGVDLTL